MLPTPRSRLNQRKLNLGCPRLALAFIILAFGPSLEVDPLAKLTTSPGPAAHVSQQYATSLVGRGGTPPYSWGVVSGALPSNVSLDGISGQIAGAPISPGVFIFTIRLSDSTGSSVSALFSLPCQGTILLSGSPPVGVVGSAYSFSISISGGVSPYTVSLS